MALFKSIKRRRLEKEGLAISSTRLKLNDTIGHYLDKSKVISILIFVILWLCCTLVLVFPHRNETSEFYLVKDQQAPKTIFAEFSFNYLNTIDTGKKREQAVSSVPLIYKIDDVASEDMVLQLENILTEISKANNPSAITSLISKYSITEESIPLISRIKSDKKKLELLKNKLSNIIYSGIIDRNEVVNAVNPESLQIRIINNNDHIRTPQLISIIPTPEEAAMEFAKSASQDYPSKNSNILKEAFSKIALFIIKPNLTQDKVLTELERQAVSSSEKNDIREYVAKGTQLIRKGEKVTPALLERFEAYEHAKSQQNLYSDFWKNFSYKLLISFVLILITFVYFYSLYKGIIFSNQKMAVVAMTIVISLFAIYFSLKGFSWLCSEYIIPSSFVTCIIPLAITPILLSVLIGLRGATFSSLLVSLVVAVKIDNYYAVILGMALTCFTSLAVYNSKNYKDFFLRSIITIPLVLIPAELLYLGRFIINEPNEIYTLVFLSLINGVLCGIVSLAVLFIVESVFQVSTNMNLLTLCDYNHPLLRRLQMEAPGTYHHSLIVATLAEQAANDIGANPIKARVCALFHDIGKLSRPEYFSENSSGENNLHNMLRPSISSMIIMNHIKDGINLAIKYKLSSIIRDAIEQHHGTDLVYFFYKRAMEENSAIEGSTITEEEYRYPGPNPVEKEIALLSIADACEAASRSLEKPTASKIESLVWEIIRKKIKDGQLDDTILSLNDLAKAKISFIKTLTSMLHSRISYPIDEDENEGDLFKAFQNSSKNIQKKV